MSKYKTLKEIAWQCNLELPKHGLVTYTFGNASAIDRDKGAVAIKPSGVSYDDLRPEDIVIVDLENNIVEGAMRPSSDTKTHIVLYRNFPDIGGIVHTHSAYATAWAQALKPIPVLGTTHADYLSVDIPCTEVISDQAIKGDYEEETGNQILEVFKKISYPRGTVSLYKEVEMVLVACHGPFTWGKTAPGAVQNSVVLEELARIALFTLNIDPNIPRLKQTIIDKHYQRKHGRNAYYGQRQSKKI